MAVSERGILGAFFGGLFKRPPKLPEYGRTMANISGKADAINGRFPGIFQALAGVGEQANGARGRIRIRYIIY
jgi:hypothetical protein